MFLFPIPQAFVAYSVSKRRNSRVKVPVTARDQPRAACEATNASDEAARGSSSVRKIQSMDISWVKRRIVETMKSIASPRRKKDASAGAGTLFARISRLLARDSTTTVSEEQSSNEAEQLCESNGGGTRNATKKQSDENERLVIVSRNEGNVWRRVRVLFVGNRWKRASSSPARRKLSKGETTCGAAWRKTVHVEKLCTGSSKVIGSSCRRGDRCQTEPLVVPDTPDTPGETSENRSHTSDLTVLLADS